MAKFMVLYLSSISARDQLARTILDRHPHLGLPGTSIEVPEMLSMPGM
jgi:hypothetical protein